MKLAVRWERATSEASRDGVAQLFKGGRVRAEKTDLADGLSVLRSVQIGIPVGSFGTRGGDLIFDDVVITR